MKITLTPERRSFLFGLWTSANVPFLTVVEAVEGIARDAAKAQREPSPCGVPGHLIAHCRDPHWSEPEARLGAAVCVLCESEISEAEASAGHADGTPEGVPNSGARDA